MFIKYIVYGGLNNKLSPRGSYTSTPGPQLVAMFEEVMEPLGGRALLKEVNHCAKTFRLYSLALLPAQSPFHEYR